MTQKTVKIAVLTDLHAFSGKSDDHSPSWLALGEDQSNPKTNPFASLKKLISDENLTADLVLCCGDMGDKASPEGQQYVWREVIDLKSALLAKQVAGTAGNHDLDSRFGYTKYDARGQVQALSPPFPVENSKNWMEYWAKNFTSIDFEDIRMVLLNSAAYHGYAKNPDEPEYEHGRISDRTLDRLIEEIKSEGEKSVNILVCHHHPHKNDLIKITDYSQMENGDRLVNELTASRTGPWLIIHGHKHMPRVYYASGGNSAPAIFSAGSFSARLYPEYVDRARNEFYIIEVEVPQSAGAATSVKGKIRTWQWSYGNGWGMARAGQGLGPSAAFGTRASIGDLAQEVSDELKANHMGQSLTWTEVIGIKPSLQYLIPEDLDLLLYVLKNTFGINSVADFTTGIIAEVHVR